MSGKTPNGSTIVKISSRNQTDHRSLRVILKRDTENDSRYLLISDGPEGNSVEWGDNRKDQAAEFEDENIRRRSAVYGSPDGRRRRSANGRDRRRDKKSEKEGKILEETEALGSYI